MTAPTGSTAPRILALVRHAESTWIAEGRFQGRGDPPLSEFGALQAMALGARLAAPATAPEVPVPDAVPQVIWHSPLRRAAQTAAAIHEAREADAPLRQLDELTELSQGEWEGLTHAQVEADYPDQLAAWRADPFTHHPPGGESLSEALERARRATDVILKREGPVDAAELAAGVTPAEPVLTYERTIASRRRPWSVVVAHDGILRLLMLGLMGIPIDRFWAFPFALAAVTVLDLSTGVRLRAHNLDAHIAALTRQR